MRFSLRCQAKCVALALAALSLWVGLPSSALPRAAAQSEDVSSLIEAVNRFRAENGQPALEPHPALMAAAQGHATWLAVNYEHSHMGPGGSMPSDRARAAGYSGSALENVASGTLGYATIAWAIQGWAGSPGHRYTMLLDSAHIGAGIAANDEEMYFVILVGGSSPPPPPAGNAPAARGNSDETPDEPVAVVAVPVLTSAPREDGSVVHVVQAGQSAWDIAAAYGVALSDLVALNFLGQRAVIHPGDEILVRLAPGQAPPPPPTPEGAHVVTEGETVWEIAVTHGLTVDELLGINGLQRPAVIKPGDVLLLQAPEPTPTAAPTQAATSLPAPVASRTPTPTAASSTDTPVASSTATAPVTRSATPRAATLAETPITSTAASSPVTAGVMAPAASRVEDHDQEDTDRAVLIGAGIASGLGLLAAAAGARMATRGKKRSP